MGLHHVFAEALSISQSHQSEKSSPDKSPEFEEVAYVKGIENPTEASHNILRWLVKHGYSDKDIALVMGENILRALKEIWY